MKVQEKRLVPTGSACDEETPLPRIHPRVHSARKLYGLCFATDKTFHEVVRGDRIAQIVGGVAVTWKKFGAGYARDMLVHLEQVPCVVIVMLRLGPVMIGQVAMVLRENGIRVRLGGITVGLGNFLLRLSHRRMVVH